MQRDPQLTCKAFILNHTLDVMLSKRICGIIAQVVSVYHHGQHNLVLWYPQART